MSEQPEPKYEYRHRFGAQLVLPANVGVQSVLLPIDKQLAIILGREAELTS